MILQLEQALRLPAQHVIRQALAAGSLEHDILRWARNSFALTKGEPMLAYAVEQASEAATGLDWGSIKFAEPLATLSTVLAAFVFASIAVLLATPPKRKTEPDFSSTVYLLLSLFVCLIGSAFFFSVLEALKETSRLNIMRASLMGTMVSYGFWLSGLLMALSIIWLCNVYRLEADIVRRANFLFRSVMFGCTDHS